MEYLSSAGKELRYWIDPRRLRVDDTMILSFLLYEQQPEEGLKELATLFGISDYAINAYVARYTFGALPADNPSTLMILADVVPAPAGYGFALNGWATDDWPDDNPIIGIGYPHIGPSANVLHSDQHVENYMYPIDLVDTSVIRLPHAP